jgi:hypothetical protein
MILLIIGMDVGCLLIQGLRLGNIMKLMPLESLNQVKKSSFLIISADNVAVADTNMVLQVSYYMTPIGLYH